MEQHGQSNSFATDQISAFRSVYLISHYRLHELFHPIIDDQELESICIPHNVFNEVNIEGDCILKQVSTLKMTVGPVMPYPTLSFPY